MLIPFNICETVWQAVQLVDCYHRKMSVPVVGLPARGLQGDVVYLSWPIAPLFYEPKCGGGGCGVSANENSCAHGAQISFGDLPQYLTYAPCHQVLAPPFSLVRYGEVLFWPHFLCICASAVDPDSHWFLYPDLRWQKWTAKRKIAQKCFVLNWWMFSFEGLKTSYIAIFCQKYFLNVKLYHFWSSNLWMRIRFETNAKVQQCFVYSETVKCLPNFDKELICNHINWLSDYAGHLPEQRGVQMGPPVRWLSVPLF